MKTLKPTLPDHHYFTKHQFHHSFFLENVPKRLSEKHIAFSSKKMFGNFFSSSCRMPTMQLTPANFLDFTSTYHTTITVQV